LLMKKGKSNLGTRTGRQTLQSTRGELSDSTMIMVLKQRLGHGLTEVTEKEAINFTIRERKKSMEKSEREESSTNHGTHRTVARGKDPGWGARNRGECSRKILGDQKRALTIWARRKREGVEKKNSAKQKKGGGEETLAALNGGEKGTSPSAPSWLKRPEERIQLRSNLSDKRY